MPTTFLKKKHKQHYIVYTFITALLISAVFLSMVFGLYNDDKLEAEETLHVQTKQIKDDIILQVVSDRENLATMANFAATLYSEEECYDIMFESFQPIGLIENIGILNADNTFVTKAGVSDVSEYFSFEEEVKKGAYISSRVSDITTKGKEIIRSAVPITVGDTTVGILYGVVQLDKIGARYEQMAKDLDAQLFIYDKNSGDLIVDNIHNTLGNISFLKDRKYIQGYSYEDFATTDKGFTSFESAYKDEDVYMHYSTIEEIGWMIALVRYDSQVFANTVVLTRTLLLAFALMIGIIFVYILVLMRSEKYINDIISCASDVRKILLETSGEQGSIAEALKVVCEFAKSRSAIFFNTDGEEYYYTTQNNGEVALNAEEKNYLQTELLRYVAELHTKSGKLLNILCIKPNKHLAKTNPVFYTFLKQHAVFDVSLSGTVNSANHTTILVVINAKRGDAVRTLAEKTSACFSMALYNKNYLNRTKLVATTDSLTGALNRVAYKSDLFALEREKPSRFCCIYVDVNELHSINNKYGHAVGDEMLIFIANTLKEAFHGHKVYRMGGDEFLVFCQNVDPDEVKKNVEFLNGAMRSKQYHIAIGVSYRVRNNDVEEMVREAEVRMYDAKAQYYQNKEQKRDMQSNQNFVQVKTGIPEIDAVLSVLKEHYNGIYRVSLDTDTARRILMPAYLQYNEDEDNFSRLFSTYISESVHPDYHRAVMSFLNYDALKHQLADNKIPKITFKKNSGEHVMLSVYKLSETDSYISDTLWVFAKA